MRGNSVVRERPFVSFWSWAVFLVALLALAPSGTAQGIEDAVEPIVTEETLPNEQGELTARLIFEHRTRDGESEGSRPALSLFYGLSERFGASLSVPVAFNGSHEGTAYGLGDLSFGLKYLLAVGGEDSPAIVLGIEAEAPTGDEERDLGEGAWEVEPFVAVLRDWGPLSLQGNFGWSKQVSGSEEGALTYNWALAVPAMEHKLHLLVEINGDRGEAKRSALAPGVKWQLSEEGFLAMAVPIGLNDRTPKWGVVAQLQVAIP